MKYKSILLVLMILPAIIHAQSVGIGTASPDASAILDIHSSSKGLLIPQVALSALNVAAPVVNPANGLMVYNTASAGASPNDVSPGYFTWSTNTVSWNRMLSATESLWLNMATGTPSVNIADDIYRTQRVSIGGPGNVSNSARLQVDIGNFYNLGFLVSGNFNNAAVLPNLGAGSRMMFYPGKSAFRAGYVTDTQWDDLKSGKYSVALGRNTIASATSSFAVGDSSIATGNYSFAAGFTDSAIAYASTAIGAGYYTATFLPTYISYSKAAGMYSTALGGGHALGDGSVSIGVNSESSGLGAIALGGFSKADGYLSIAGPNSTAPNYLSTAFGHSNAEGSYSAAIGYAAYSKSQGSLAFGFTDTTTGFQSASMGLGTYARAAYSLALGQYNDSIAGSNPNNFVATDPLLIIGNGTSLTARSNAAVIYKNGDMSINGYTRLGKVSESAPSVKMKEIVMNTPGTQGAFNFAAHGLTQSKIVSISGLATVPGGYQIVPNHLQAGYEYTLNVDNSNIAVGTVSGNSGAILNAPVKILIIYEE